MACIPLVPACALFLFAIVANHENRFAECRQLREMEIQGTQSIDSSNGSTGQKDDHQVPPTARDMKHPPFANERLQGFLGSVKADKDDFRPTTPGKSPGVGHYHMQQKGQIAQPMPTIQSLGQGGAAIAEKDHLHPTSPGSIPGIDHHFTQQKEKNSMPMPTVPTLGFLDKITVHADDFRPTTPGSSPGVGHSYAQQKYDSQSKALDKNQVVRQSTAGDTDDIRRTSPGHSPGVGHAEPNT